MREHFTTLNFICETYWFHPHPVQLSSLRRRFVEISSVYVPLCLISCATCYMFMNEGSVKYQGHDSHPILSQYLYNQTCLQQQWLLCSNWDPNWCALFWIKSFFTLSSSAASVWTSEKQIEDSQSSQWFLCQLFSWEHLHSLSEQPSAKYHFSSIVKQNMSMSHIQRCYGRWT